ncbi:MAG: LysM peptidoglycan-binding domain-containing protein [Ilumatobacteraceae bacterium]
MTTRVGVCRVSAMAASILLFGVACAGAGSTDSIQNLTPIQGSSYVTIPPATSTTTTTTLVPPTTAPATELDTLGEQVYVVQPNDGLAKIAELYGITMEEVVRYNGYEDGFNHVFFPGDEVRIPPNAKVPDAGASGGSSGDCPTTYVITADDTSRISVAERFGITYQQMDAANVSTPGYKSFVLGRAITIPCP